MQCEKHMIKKTMLNSNNKSLSVFIIPLLFLFFFLLVLSPPSSAHDHLELKSLFPQCPFSKLISFGDSFTDTGNAKLLGGLIAFAKALVEGSPYGSTFFKNKPSNRLCDGRLVIDFLSETLRLPSFIPPYKDVSANFSFGVNFAIAGSTSLPGDFYHVNRVGRTLPWKDIPDSIQKQIDWFTEFMTGEHGVAYKAEMHNVLFWIGEMGGSDYLRTFGHSLKVETLTQMAVDHVCKVLQTALDHGAKFIVVQALPPSGCSPLDMLLAPPYDRDMMGCAGSANAVVQAHNRLLQQKLKDYEKKYPDCMILYADYWGAYQAILENPALHGFEEPFKACCGGGSGLFNFDLHAICGSSGTEKCADPSKYINWDGVHLTEAMYRKISELFFSKDYCKPSFGDLINRRLSFGNGGGGSVSVSQGQGQGQQSGQANGDTQQSGDSGNQGQQSAQGKTDGGAQQAASGGASSGSQGQGQGQQIAQNTTEGDTQQSASGGGGGSGSQSQGQQSSQTKGDAGAQQSGSGGGAISGSISGGGAISGSQGQGQQSSQDKAGGAAQQSGSGGGSISGSVSGGGAISGSQGQGQQSSQDKAGGAAQQSGSGGGAISGSVSGGGAISGSQGQGQQSSQGGAAQQSGSGDANSGSQGQGQQSGKSGGSNESSSGSVAGGGGGAQQSGGSGGKSDMHFKGQKSFQYKTEQGMSVSCVCTYS